MNYRIWLSPPHMSGGELKYVQEAFDSNWIAPAGPNIRHFENELAQYTGAKYAVALASGTAAVHLALCALGIEKGDIVLCQSLTFVATANPILYLGATPVFIDSESKTWNICPEALETAVTYYIKRNQKPKALICVHLYGMPCLMNELLAICDKYGIALIEDAAEALGSTYTGKHLGTFGKAGIISFNGNKIITTSGGGALLSDSKTLTDKARFLATQAKDPASYFQHSEAGYNYALSNVCAGIGRGQMEVLNERVAARRSNFNRHQQYLAAIPGISFQEEPAGGYSNRWLTTLELSSANAGSTPEKLIQALSANGIEARRVWKPMHLQPLYKTAPYFGGNVAENLFENGVCLPSGSQLTEKEVTEISNVIIELIENKKGCS
ncbi:aminotransferase class I/II-fold pyridoxal phosphate-dependent enzyme [Dyadobacter sp. CY343]|uniref:aminotransferase class I/II-fold pyridoxal phosphate-dependent enzyme n=1 Tax=Dyadobacter sp. CY343 TaxID=2907299 RepID=UPI001F45A1DA|nr:aminotransferase class I/II-fold pyridoxal phosphate-dependent enzyme [Dyadobacter sp. CY343]MCE7062870.1 aminotransferase class I/II-fold pyridoxal phosphate-dependent enzyme [Dyadobacter sp. CY343]